MNLVRPVRATKVHQQGMGTPARKPGKPYNGPNLVQQRQASAKKTARRASTRKAA